MARKRKLDPEQEIALVDMVHKGFSNHDIAKKFGIAESSVGSYYRRTMRERGRERQRQQRSDRLVATREVWQMLVQDCDGDYYAIWRRDDGDDIQKIDAENDAEATIMFDAWLEEESAREEFMSKVERREKVEEPMAKEHGASGAYLIWQKSPEVKTYGLFRTMESALAKVEAMNEASRLLMGQDCFEIEELEWRE